MFLVAMFATAQAQQNITVTAANGQNISQFIATHMLGGGVYVTNVKFNNASGNIATPQIGTFNANGYTNLMMSSGVIMTTGNVSVAPGPNDQGGKSTPVSPIYSDPQMSSIASGSINGCATLDFDFVSVSPFINVNYCFASEEYPEYVCSNYNDVFAFFITGPDPNTGQSRTWNMARIPHTIDAQHPDGIPVTINAVNQGVAPSSSGTGCYYNFSEYYVANHTAGASGGPNNAPGVQYDGFTRKLAASSIILPCEQYHMHISICNVGDNAFDSGVFLEGGSFNSPQAQVHFAPADIDTVFRSHVHAVPLTLAGSDYTYGLMRLQFSGTAANETDYVCYTDAGDTLTQYYNYIYLSADTTHYLYFKGTNTANLNHPRTINISMTTNLCENFNDLKGYDTLRLILAEDDIVRLRDTVITAHEVCTEVGVEVDFSRRPLSFQWIPEDNIYFPQQQYSSANITESCTYHVAAHDDRGNADTAEVQIVVIPTPAGIGDEAFADGVALYPNPADARLHVAAQGLTRVEMFTVAGQQVVDIPCVGNAAIIDTTPLEAGIYTVRILTAEGSVTRKVAVR